MHQSQLEPARAMNDPQMTEDSPMRNLRAKGAMNEACPPSATSERVRRATNRIDDDDVEKHFTILRHGICRVATTYRTESAGHRMIFLLCPTCRP